jgi:hypothetical protein
VVRLNALKLTNLAGAGGGTNYLTSENMSYYLAGQHNGNGQEFYNMGGSAAPSFFNAGDAGLNAADASVYRWADPTQVDVTVDGVGYRYVTSNLLSTADSTFQDDPGGWTIEDVWTIDTVAGVAEGNGANGFTEEMRYDGLLTSGKTYLVQSEVSEYTSGSVDAYAGVLATSASATGTFTSVATATSTIFKFSPTNFQGSITNVIVREVFPVGDYLYFPGTANNTIQLDRPVASVDVVVTYLDDSTDTSLTAQTADPLVLGGTDAVFADKQIKSIQLLNNSGGAEVGLFQAANSSQSGETDSYANDWTINRSSSGAKSVLVTTDIIGLDSSVSSFLSAVDTGDYFDVADGQPFTVGVWVRVHGTPQNYSGYITKYNGADGWRLLNWQQTNYLQFLVDGPGGNTVTSGETTPTFSASEAVLLSGTRTETGIYDAVDSTLGAEVTPQRGALANSETVKVGNNAGGASYGDYEIMAWWHYKGIIDDWDAFTEQLTAQINGEVRD